MNNNRDRIVTIITTTTSIPKIRAETYVHKQIYVQTYVSYETRPLDLRREKRPEVHNTANEVI